MPSSDDVIVVDDEPIQIPQMPQSSNTAPGPVAPESFYASPPKTIAEAVMRQRAARRSTPAHLTRLSTGAVGGGGGMRAQPKLKLKLSEKAAAMTGTSFLGPYDRELDSDDEDLAFEEQFILRVPPVEDLEKLRKMVAAREASPDVWFKFKDSRRAVFHIGNNLYSAKLVDLPCIIESQKTLDNKQMFKVADICQMLVVEDQLENEEVLAQQKSFNIDEFIWQHGITPPLHHVRKRRFRKRVNRRTIETVEQEVERLLEADASAAQVQYDILENVNPDLSDSEFIDREEPMDAATPGLPGSDAGDATPAPGGEDDEKDDMDMGDGEIDEELAAELDLALGDEGEDGDEEDEDEEDQSDEDEDEDDEDEEATQSKRLLNEEIRDLEAAVAKKGHEIASSANPLIKRRFEDALKKLQADLEVKCAQRDELNEQRRLRKEGVSPQQRNSEQNEDVDDDEGMGVE